MKALIVDDSSTMRRIEKNILKQIGFEEFVEAISGRDALKRFTQDRFDLILMDINMPEMNGIEALESIRRTDNETPIVMVTSDSDKATVIRAIKAGANQYIVKPFKEDIFKKKVVPLLPKEDEDA